jgi:membrane protease YdiL (CAAX protease family)
MSDAAPKPNPSLWSLPEIPRVLPFAVFLVFTSLQGKYFAGSEYWLYAVKTLAAAGLIWHFRPRLAELKWAVSWEAIVVGIGIAALWLGLDGRIPSVGAISDWVTERITGKIAEPAKPEAPWNPLAFFQGNAALGYAFLAVRVLGRSIVVPMVEELFYRSFFYRYLVNPDFVSTPHRTWNPVAFLVTTLAFGLSHPGQWVPALLCGAAYQYLVIRKNRLGDAMTAHGITNAVISAYAIATGKWEFT